MTRVRLATRLAILLVALATADGARAAQVRVFAVGQKQRLEDALTIERFRAKMFALVDAARRSPGLVQDGVDDVASHVRPRDPAAPALAVVHFPEDTGLVAGLVGTRGAPARAVATSAEAFLTLLGSYGDVVAYYDETFPALASQPLRGLVIALTDVLYRAVYETFRDIAREYGVYVSVSLNAAPARRVDASEDAELVERLRDPDEPGRDYAYVATSDLPHNLVWLFDPSGEVLVPLPGGALARSPSTTGGEIQASAWKSYLTPIEQALDKPGGGLSLAAGPVRDLDVLDTPVGAIGVVISKDAWMPDVNERFDAKGANFTLQSEAFSEWAYADVPWQPDVFRESGFANLQTHAGFLFDVAPSMTGNLFDVTFDGQSAILEKRRDKRARAPGEPGGWIGQLPSTGFVAVAPWIVADPTEAGGRSRGSLARRRRALADAGARLVPGSGVACPTPLAAGSCENGYRESIVFADLDVPPSPYASGSARGPDAEAHPIDRGTAPTRFGASTRVAPGGPGRQRHPRIAADGSLVAVVWDDTRGDTIPRIWLAVSRDGGASFDDPVKASSDPAPDAAAMLPDVAVHGSEISVVWQSFEIGFQDDAGAIRFARFDDRGRKLSAGRDVRVDDGATAPGAAHVGRWHPAIAALPSGVPVVAWIDERDRGPDGVLLEHVYAARGIDDGDGVARFAPSVRVDAGAPTRLAESHDNKWAPAIAVDGDGTVHVAWADFRDYNWDVYAARSTDGGASFGANLRVNGFPDFERICDAPRFAAGAAGRATLAWTDVRAREPDTNVFLAETRDGGASWSADRPIDASSRTLDPDEDVPSDQSHVALAARGGRTFAVWQDDREGNNDVVFAEVDTAAATPAGRIERVDDSGSGPSNQYRPQLAIAGTGVGARCIIVWEDDREGRLRIYRASAPCAPANARRLPSLARSPG
ncbi:MAG TPA: hypothetical protein VFD92_06755 [Candidatus Binatia bacterium]|nr:hypothetical protein [Candidatus Binatia bacterium]